MKKRKKHVIKRRGRKPRREAVNNPSHYGGETNPYETIKILEAKLSPEEYRGFLLGCVFKYNDRAGKKSDTRLEDFRKAQWYQNELVRITEATEG